MIAMSETFRPQQGPEEIDHEAERDRAAEPEFEIHDQTRPQART